MNKKLLAILLNLVLLLPSVASAACPSGSGSICLNLSYPKFGTFDLNDNQDLNEVIAWFYYFIVAVSGFAAFVMLVIGGFKWLSSSGNPSTIGDAKDQIQKALLGLLLILVSWLVLQVINPDLIILRPVEIQ
ncbi:MAG: hypothetical protein HY443_00200 [Candidatus Nealsonbacteria bacterium]|nr:hypothetical protein [Candidatus Nealsonbacteria bacterium]